MSRPNLYIDSSIFYQLLSDRAFYDALPATLEPLRKKAEAAYADALKVAMGQASCNGCTSIKGVLGPIMSEYGQALALIHKEAPSLLDPLVTYLTSKRGYRPPAIVMYYRGTDGRTETLSI